MMLVRRATLADIASIMQLVRLVVPVMRASGNNQWDDKYPNPEVFGSDIAQNQLWVADDEGQISGVAAITTEQYEGYTQVGWDITEPAIVVHRLAVSPLHQGKGIAVLLLDEAEQEARRRDIPLLRIDTNSENVAAQNLFKKVGYVYAGEFSLDFRPGLRFCCLEKRLNQ